MAIVPSIWPFADRPRRAIPLKLRLQAWWQGYDAEYFAAHQNALDPASAAASSRNFQSVFDPAEKQAGDWTELRAKVVQDIWTRGFIVPGGEQYAADLLSGCGLNPAETMLEIGIGFGGSTRAIIERYGNYVMCYERNLALAKEARRQAALHNVSDKLEIEHANLEKVKVKHGYFRAALLREVFYTIEGKAILLEKLRNAMKVGESQVIITDLMFDEGATGPELERWIKAEPDPVYPSSLDLLTKTLMKLGFVIRAAEDESRLYRRMIIDAWKAYLTTLDTESLPTLIGRQIVHEADFWSARIGAIDAQAVRYVRVVAVRNS
jgi:cyclopropane fatty-acyl-phospholipid synthase-like methyltransferase